jgi:hypothetical protein
VCVCVCVFTEKGGAEREDSDDCRMPNGPCHSRLKWGEHPFWN